MEGLVEDIIVEGSVEGLLVGSLVNSLGFVDIEVTSDVGWFSGFLSVWFRIRCCQSVFHARDFSMLVRRVC